MISTPLKMKLAFVVVAVSLLAAGAVIAQNPGWAGPDVSQKSAESKARNSDKGGPTAGAQKAFQQDEEIKAQRARDAAATVKPPAP